MKRCPACHARYADDVAYCVTDGTALSAEPSSVDELSALAEPTSRPSPPAPSRGVSPLAAAGLVVATLAVCALAWVLVTQQQRTAAMEETVRLADARAAEAERQAADAGRQAADAGRIAREAQLADAEARARRAEDDASRADTPPPVAARGGYTSVAWADSPSDGFLALRTQPSTRTGQRIARIPHGAQIALGACRPTSQVPGGRAGQWCRTRWGGLEGWAFTAFMQF